MLRLVLGIWWVHCSLACVAAEFPAPRQVDERRAAQVGLRKIVGQHLRLYTDLPVSDAVDGLANVFDAAVPQWAEYFQIAPENVRSWQMQGFLVQDRAKFAALGLLPEENPDFENGYSVGYELWLMDQPSDYYRRHLLLHEGTHGFMYTQLGETGPGWYMEGMAELFGTHRWQDGKLWMRQLPRQRQEVPMWGRTKLIRDAHREGKQLTLSEILTLDKRRALTTTEYAWCWALCQLLDSNPERQPKFRKLYNNVREAGFNQRFRNQFRQEWPDLLVEWSGYVATLDYGYDLEQMAMQHRSIEPVTEGASVTLDAGRGWQSTGWRFEAGQACRVTAEGRYQIAHDGEPWPCEPGGVTLRYHAGQPLGRLLGAWRATETHSFSPSFAIGLASDLKPQESAVLYLRVNDSPAELSDNRGTLTVRAHIAAD